MRKQKLYPINTLSKFASMIAGQIAENEKQYTNLQAAKDKPYILDDEIINRVLSTYTEQSQLIKKNVYECQFDHWRKNGVTPKQEKEIKRLELQVEQLRKLIKDILVLTMELQESTINKICGMDDAELGFKILSGEIPFPQK